MARANGTIDQTSRGRRVPVDHRRLPARPLLEVVHGLARRRHQTLEELFGADAEQRNPWPLNLLRNAEASGQITVATGEDVCDLLGWHPRMVWGDLYDTTIRDTTPHTASAAPGTTTAWRQGCRCLDCREANRAAIARSAARRRNRNGGERPA